MIDRDDVEQAIEIACGDTVGYEMGERRTASQRAIDRLRAGFLRLLKELPPDTYVHEILEVLEDEHETA